jgi:HPt (histidine-containing phosphotransfer) domain-containing protein
MKGDRERCLKAGMDSYVSKPIDADQLYKALAAVVPRRGTEISAARKSEPAGMTVAAEPLASELPDNDAPVMDWDLALLGVQNRTKLLLEMAELFLDECPKQLEDIPRAIAERNLSALQRIAHTMMSSAGYFAAKSAIHAARHLEALATEGDLKGAAQAFPELQHTFQRLMAELANVLETASNKSFGLGD